MPRPPSFVLQSHIRDVTAMRTSAWIAAAVGLCGFWITQRLPIRAALSSANPQTTTSVSVEAEMKAGEAADAKKDYATAMAAYRRVIEMQPENIDAHKRFVMASWSQAEVEFEKLYDNPDYEKLRKGKLHGRAKKAIEAELKKASAESKAGDDALLATYDQWIAAYPKMAVFYWAEGYVLQMLEKPTGKEELFRKAISLDPKFAPAYNSMAGIEFDKGDYVKQREYLQQVMELDPANAEAAREFAETFQFTDPTEFRQLAERYAERFPRDSDCTYLLYQLENAEPHNAARLAVLERMRRSYLDEPVSTVGMDQPDVFTGWLEDAMIDLFNLYGQSNPQEAFDLAQEMQKRTWADPDWKKVVAYQQNLMRAQQLITLTKYSEASALLQQPYTGWLVTRGLNHTPMDLAKAKALAGNGNIQQAFDTLAAAWIKAPDPQLKAALLKCGTKLGKTSEQVDDYVWQKWTANAKKMKPFKLKEVLSGKKIKLSDFRGRVILVSFWFPLCGPCRGEMPYFDEVAKKYQPQGFVILAINGIPVQNSLAPGVLKNYDIMGLQVPSNKWAKKYDNVQGYPTNYLLDAKGRIMAHPDVRSVDALKTLERQIDALLARGQEQVVANAHATKSSTDNAFPAALSFYSAIHFLRNHQQEIAKERAIELPKYSDRILCWGRLRSAPALPHRVAFPPPEPAR